MPKKGKRNVKKLCLRNIWMPPLVIEATDKDSGINALLVYEILEAEAKTFFAIDESTGALRTMVSLDFETKQRFEFEVRVSDRGLPRLTADSTTKVSICNINFSRQIATSLRGHRKSNYAHNFSRQITTILKANCLLNSNFVFLIGVCVNKTNPDLFYFRLLYKLTIPMIRHQNSRPFLQRLLYSCQLLMGFQWLKLKLLILTKAWKIPL